MIFLAAVGPAVESLSGSLRFLAVYLFGGLVGLLLHSIIVGHGLVVGASGCVAAIVAYYCVAYPNMRVPLAPKLPAPIWSVAILWLGLQVLGGFVKIGDSGGVAFWTHVGGFLAGIVLSVLFKAPIEAERRHSQAVLSVLAEESAEARVQAAREHLAKFPGDTNVRADLAEGLKDAGDRRAEIEVRLQLIDELTESSQAQHLGRLAELGALDRISSLRRSMLADRFLPSRPNLSIQLWESIVADPHDAQRPEAILALATALRGKDDSKAVSLIRLLEETYPLHAATEVARTKGWLS
jgi:hypothetical protein